MLNFALKIGLPLHIGGTAHLVSVFSPFSLNFCDPSHTPSDLNQPVANVLG